MTLPVGCLLSTTAYSSWAGIELPPVLWRAEFSATRRSVLRGAQTGLYRGDDDGRAVRVDDLDGDAGDGQAVVRAAVVGARALHDRAAGS